MNAVILMIICFTEGTNPSAWFQLNYDRLFTSVGFVWYSLCIFYNLCVCACMLFSTYFPQHHFHFTINQLLSRMVRMIIYSSWSHIIVNFICVIFSHLCLYITAVRLIDGSECSGTPEVLHGGTWWKVCLDAAVLSVICRHLGCGNVLNDVHVTASVKNSKSARKMNCTGNEKTLEACTVTDIFCDVPAHIKCSGKWNKKVRISKN